MDMNLYIWAAIIGGSIVTLLPRILPITILSKINLPEPIEEFLSYIPVAILSALVAVELFTAENQVNLSANILDLLVAIPTIWIAIKKKDLLLTVLVGIISMALLRFLL